MLAILPSLPLQVWAHADHKRQGFLDLPAFIKVGLGGRAGRHVLHASGQPVLPLTPRRAVPCSLVSAPHLPGLRASEPCSEQW